MKTNDRITISTSPSAQPAKKLRRTASLALRQRRLYYYGARYLLMFVCIASCFFIALSSCSKKTRISSKEKQTVLEILENDMIADGDRMNHKEEIKKLIKNVYQEVSLTVIWELKDSESFLKLEECSYELLDVAFELLESDELTLREKIIIIYAVQNVDFERLKYFFRDLTIGFRDGKIDEYLVVVCILPEDNWSYALMRNYRDRVIREAFNIYLKSGKTCSEFRNIIQLAKRGELWRTVREHIIEIRKWKGLPIDDLVKRNGGRRQIGRR